MKKATVIKCIASFGVIVLIAFMYRINRAHELEALKNSDCDAVMFWRYHGADVYLNRIVVAASHQDIHDDDLKRLNDIPTLIRLDLSDNPISNQGLRNINDCSGLTMLNLARTLVTDIGCDEIQRRFPALETLDLADTQITDSGVAQLTDLSRLRFLVLNHNALTDDSLKSISSMKSVESIDMKGTRVTDSGLAILAGLPHLRTIDLSSTTISDRGLDALGAMNELTSVYVVHTQVTPEGVQRFKIQHPGTSIYDTEQTGLRPRLSLPGRAPPPETQPTTQTAPAEDEDAQ